MRTFNNMPSKVALEENAGPSENACRVVYIGRAQPQGMLGPQRGFAPGDHSKGEDHRPGCLIVSATICVKSSAL